MAAGGPGDHPLYDVVKWKLSVYGDEVDELIRKIAVLSSEREMLEWWEKKIGWPLEPEKALAQAKIRYAEVLKRARDSGWEVPS